MALRNRFTEKVRPFISEDEWLVARENYDPEENLAYESIFGLANGNMGNRAIFEEGGVRKTLPANYIHGVFDKSEAFMRELANTPNWVELKMYYECNPIGIEDCKDIKDFITILDMKNGIVCKHYIVCSSDGRETLIERIKFLSRVNANIGTHRTYFTPLNYSGLIEFENNIDGTITNFIDFPRFRVKHLNTLDIHDMEGMGCYVESETRDFKLPIGTATAIQISNENEENKCRSKRFSRFGEMATEFFDALCEEKETLIIDKYAAICTGRHFDNVYEACKKQLTLFMNNGFEKELKAHFNAYQQLWAAADVRITGDNELQKALRFNIFHLMSTPNPKDNGTNIGAKLIHGEEYGGHAFWDTELFTLPFFTWVFPNIAQKLVEYRYNLLDKAKENAIANGYKGAKYPWESADTGDEECPSWTIEPDGTCYRCYVADYEHHVTSAVAYGANRYFEVTNDEEFMATKGIKIILETARFWVSRCEYVEESDQYNIYKVTGPDEWHEPVDNNAYTNHLAKWNILKAVELIGDYEKNNHELYNHLCKELNLSKEELIEWVNIANKINLKGTEGLIEQFDGYFDLEDVIIAEWDENNMPIAPQRMREIPKQETSILKQADVVMLMFLLENTFDMETQKINFEYYEKRTLHRSSLSPSIHCLMGLRVGDSKRAYDYLARSAFVDIYNNQGNTREGLHAASAGGTWQCVVMGYCGMAIDKDGILHFKPKLPDKWDMVSFNIVWKGTPLHITVAKDDVVVISQEPIPYRVNDEERKSAS